MILKIEKDFIRISVIELRDNAEKILFDIFKDPPSFSYDEYYVKKFNYYKTIKILIKII